MFERRVLSRRLANRVRDRGPHHLSRLVLSVRVSGRIKIGQQIHWGLRAIGVWSAKRTAEVISDSLFPVVRFTDLVAHSLLPQRIGCVKSQLPAPKAQNVEAWGNAPSEGSGILKALKARN